MSLQELEAVAAKACAKVGLELEADLDDPAVQKVVAFGLTAGIEAAASLLLNDVPVVGALLAQAEKALGNAVEGLVLRELSKLAATAKAKIAAQAVVDAAKAAVSQSDVPTK